MTDSTWRAFIGEWVRPGVPYRTSVDLRHASWTEARDALAEFARRELDVQTEAGPDATCEHCKTAAEECLTALAALTEDSTWFGDIDHDELTLTREVDGG